MTNRIKALIACLLLLAAGAATMFGQRGHSFDIAGMDTKTSACTN